MRRLFGLGFAVTMAGISGSAAAAPTTPAPFSRLPDIVLNSAPAKTHATPIAPAGDWARAAPNGTYTVVGFTSANGVLEGDAGHGFLYPGAKKLPVGDLESYATAFSADGKYLVVGSSWHASKLTKTSPWRNAHPVVTVMTVPDLRIVQSFDGMNAVWLGTTDSIAFRRGNQAYRLDIATGGAPMAVGIPQSAFGCRYEDFGPDKPCKSGHTSNLRAVDPGLTGWLVDDECISVIDGGNATPMCQPAEAFRVFELATGKTRTIASVSAPLDGIFEDISPSRSRACFWLSIADKNSLSCLTLPSGTPEVLIASGDRGIVTWLDDQRILVTQDTGARIFDLSARTMTNVVGIPKSSGIPIALSGGKRIALQRPTAIIDLDRKTFAPGPAGDADIEAIPNDAHHVVLHPHVKPGPFVTLDL